VRATVPKSLSISLCCFSGKKWVASNKALFATAYYIRNNYLAYIIFTSVITFFLYTNDFFREVHTLGHRTLSLIYLFSVYISANWSCSGEQLS